MFSSVTYRLRGGLLKALDPGDIGENQVQVISV